MKKSDWQNWLEIWFQRHPLKEPPESAQGNYAEEVMVRIRRLEEPSRRGVLAWLPRPAPTLAWNGALAAALAIVVLASSNTDRKEPDLVEELEALEAVSAADELLSDEEVFEELRLLEEGDASASSVS